MGNSHPQTNRGPSERAKTQSPQPVGKNSHREADSDEPAELNDVTRGRTDSQGESTPEEQEIDRRLETKVGLALVVLLAGAFSFMVWQKWSHRQQETYAQTESETNEGEFETGESQANQPPLELYRPEPSSDSPPLDPFEQNEAIVQVGEKKTVHPLLELKPAREPVARTKPEPATRAKLEQDDPFAPATSTRTVTEQTKPSKAVDPFGDEWAGDPQPTTKPEEPPVLELETLAGKIENPSSDSKENPFGETNESQPVLRFESAEGEPFADPPSKSVANPEIRPGSPARSAEFPDGPALTRQSEQSLEESEPSFTEPIPVLERVPERPGTASRNPFGEFEVVPAGSSRASSVTNVAGNKIAEPDPFATVPAEKPRELRVDFPDSGAESSTVKTYRIQENDTYWTISQKMYRTSRYHQALADYNKNRVGDPTKMPLGQEILIPPPRELELKYPDLSSASRAASRAAVRTEAEHSGLLTDNLGAPQYRVAENDTLSAIAQRHLGRASRWIQIYELNRKQIPDPNQLKIGTVLTLPADASNVRVIGTGTGSTLR